MREPEYDRTRVQHVVEQIAQQTPGANTPETTALFHIDPAAYKPGQPFSPQKIVYVPVVEAALGEPTAQYEQIAQPQPKGSLYKSESTARRQARNARLTGRSGRHERHESLRDRTESLANKLTNAVGKLALKARGIGLLLERMHRRSTTARYIGADAHNLSSLYASAHSAGGNRATLNDLLDSDHTPQPEPSVQDSLGATVLDVLVRAAVRQR